MYRHVQYHNHAGKQLSYKSGIVISGVAVIHLTCNCLAGPALIITLLDRSRRDRSTIPIIRAGPPAVGSAPDVIDATV